jgi:hypothetical protein
MIVWTVKQAISVPVHESNNFMLKYQMADMNINEIITAKKLFDNKYTINLSNVELLELSKEENNDNSKRKQPTPVKLSLGENSFAYVIRRKDGTVDNDANVTFLLTRPHSRNSDTLQTNVPFINGHYQTKKLTMKNAGRYTLQLRAYVNDTIGYSEISAYLKP